MRDSMLQSVFEQYYDRLAEMIQASFESVYWRQDRYLTGGIVESDERVDEGRKLYWPWCWPRTYILEPLLATGEYGRARRFLEYWIKCQRPDGNWLHCYDVRDYSEYPGLAETDNVGYMLWHFGKFFDATNDVSWISVNWESVEKAGKFLESKYNPEMKMIWGQEEANVPGMGKYKIRYSLHINCVCALGLQSSAKIARAIGKTETAKRWLEISESILSESIAQKFWDEKEKTFSFGFTESGERLTVPALWMTLMPFWLFDRFDERLADTLRYLKNRLYNKDPKISHTYWFYDYSVLIDSGKPVKSDYSGCGVWIGGLPVLIDALLKAGQAEQASEQIGKIVEWTNPENNLIPEHINTMHAGKLGNYSTYPKPYYYVDSGNLLHLSFFLTMIAKNIPKMLNRDNEGKDIHGEMV